jgi:hypothetical protein
MASTSNRVQSLLSRTRDLVRPPLAETPQFSQESVVESPPSPQTYEKLPEDSFVQDAVSKQIKSESFGRSSPRVPKPPKLSKSLEKQSVQEDLETFIEGLRQSQTRTFESTTASLRKERQLLERLGVKLQTVRPAVDSNAE